MDIERYVKIYSKNSVGGFDNNCYKINSVNDLAGIKIPADATGFCVFYRLVHTTLVNGKIFSFSYEQADKAFDNFFVRADNNIKFQQLVRAVQQFKLPNVQLVDGKKGQIKARFVERHFTSCHPEVDVFEERELPSLKNFILPKAYEKAEVIREYYFPIVVDGQKRVMRSQPMHKQTYYVGTIENVGEKTISFTTINGGLGFAKPDDIIVDPSEIDEFGRIDNFNNKL